MSTLAARRCVQHVAREAVARCPACAGDFCRECVVEHEGRLLCASCLTLEIAQAKPSRLAWSRWRDVVTTVGCFVLLWTALYFLGTIVKAMPGELHEGSVWLGRP
jgi:hypothetical protein